MLPGEQLRRSHDRGLVAGRLLRGCRLDRGPLAGDCLAGGSSWLHRRSHGGEHRVGRHGRLAAAHVALEQAVHRLRYRQVGRDLAADLPLGRCELEGKPGPDPGIEPGIDGDRRRSMGPLLLAAVHP